MIRNRYILAGRWLLKYPNLELGGVSAPFVDAKHRAKWFVESRIGNLRNIEDHKRIFVQCFKNYRTTWLYGASHSYYPFGPETPRVSKVLAAAMAEAKYTPVDRPPLRPRPSAAPLRRPVSSRQLPDHASRSASPTDKRTCIMTYRKRYDRTAKEIMMATAQMRLRLAGISWALAAAVCLLGTSPAAAQEWTTLSLRGPQHWSYVGGDWEENEAGVIRPPAVKAADRVAFYVGQMYSEVEAEFEFRWNINHCGAGFVVRAQDPSHYYLVHFPLCGQHYRAKHFWAAISKADGSGWLDILKMEMIQGVPSELGIGKGLGVSPWHKARVVVKGNEIRVWVDGRPGPVVYDDAYKSGYVGLESWGYSGPGGTFRNVKIRGQEVPLQPWNEANQPPQNWFNPWPKGEGQQIPHGGAPAGDGSLLLNISGKLLRSTDRGRTWEPVKAEGWNGGRLVRTKEGRVLAFGFEDKERTLSISEDNGQTWSAPEKVVQQPFKPDIPHNPDRPMTLGPMQGMMELQDGTLLAFHTAKGPSWKIGASILEWGGLHTTGWSTRSTDSGHTWSAPVPLDGPPAVGMCFDMCEFSSNIQTRDGKVLCLGRPIYSPWMWESWSENNGESWGPATRGHFPSYNCATLPHATASGALLIGGRMPGLGLHVSHDSGMSWKHYRIDTVIWAGGVMYEVEPDVVLWVYMGEYNPHPDARAQFIRITPDGLEPARDMLANK